MSEDARQFKRTLVIGAGAIAVEFHLPRLKALPGQPSVVLHDKSPARCTTLRGRFRGDYRVAVADRLPERESFDLVVVATPPRFHLEGVRAMSPRCRRFLVEKPMTATRDEGEALAALAEEQGLEVAVHLVRRELPTFRTLGWLYRHRSFGRGLHVDVREGLIFEWPAASAAAFSRSDSGGGVLADLGPHVLDQLRSVFPRLELRDAAHDAEGAGVDANCRLDLLGDGDVPVAVWLSRNRSLSNTTTFTFEEATCRTGATDPCLHVEPRDGQPFRIEGPGPRGNALGQLMDQFYARRIIAGDLAGVTPRDALWSQTLIEDGYARARPLTAVF